MTSVPTQKRAYPCPVCLGGILAARPPTPGYEFTHGACSGSDVDIYERLVVDPQPDWDFTPPALRAGSIRSLTP